MKKPRIGSWVAVKVADGRTVPLVIRERTTHGFRGEYPVHKLTENGLEAGPLVAFTTADIVAGR